MPPKPPSMIPTFTPSPVRPAACHALEPWSSTAGPASPLAVTGRIGRIASTSFHSGERREPVRRHVRLDAAPVEVHDASAVRHEQAGDRRCRRRGQLDRDRDRGTGHSSVDDEPRHELPSLAPSRGARRRAATAVPAGPGPGERGSRRRARCRRRRRPAPPRAPRRPRRLLRRGSSPRSSRLPPGCGTIGCARTSRSG